MARLLTQRLSKEREGSVKYSTWCHSRSKSPCEASRAMPISRGLSARMGRRGRESIAYSPFVRQSIPRGRPLVKQACQYLLDSWSLGEVRQTSPRELFLTRSGRFTAARQVSPPASRTTSDRPLD